MDTRPIAFCKLCNEKVEVNTPIKNQHQHNLWMMLLVCGHIFDWETGNCFAEQQLFYIDEKIISRLFM